MHAVESIGDVYREHFKGLIDENKLLQQELSSEIEERKLLEQELMNCIQKIENLEQIVQQGTYKNN